MSTCHKYSVRAILANPTQRRELAVRFIMSAQHMEGIDTTREQAERAYDAVQAEHAASCSCSRSGSAMFCECKG